MYFTKLIDKAKLSNITAEEFANIKYFYVIYLADLPIERGDLALVDITMQGEDRLAIILKSDDLKEVMGNVYASALMATFDNFQKNSPFVGVVLLTIKDKAKFLDAVETEIASCGYSNKRKVLGAIGQALDKIENKATLHELFRTKLSATDIKSAIVWLFKKVFCSE